jgi:hypothetical protein
MVVLLAVLASNSMAAVKNNDVKYTQVIVEDGRSTHQAQRQSYGFRVEIISDNEGVKAETYKNGRPFITAAKGENYSVRIYNPLPVRVAVNLTVDGINSISGKPSGISDGHKWMIDAYSSVTIPGWQVSGGEARRFFFTDKPKSYAKWRGDSLGRDLAANCGVIGAAYFWNQQELNQYYETHPIYRTTYRPYPYTNEYSKKSKAFDSASGLAGAPAPAPEAMKDVRAEEPQEQAGTGMGERESHPTTQVNFEYNTGMYSLSQALVIYYDFAKVSSPNPFPDGGYSPEM